MVHKFAVILPLLVLTGCGATDTRALQQENIVLRAHLAELQAQLQDCRASARGMIDVKDLVGSGSGVDTLEENEAGDESSSEPANAASSKGGGH